jgi:hypothetical protein
VGGVVSGNEVSGTPFGGLVPCYIVISHWRSTGSDVEVVDIILVLVHAGWLG